jgi:hypothetical protein
MANKIQFEHKRKFDKMMRKLYSATIQWHDNKNIEDDMLIKIGDIEDDDDNIFFYIDNEQELKEAYRDDFHEWKILDCKQIDY